MHLSPAFLALSLALTSFVVAHPMPRADAPEALASEVAKQHIRDDFHPLVRRTESADERRKESKKAWARNKYRTDENYRQDLLAKHRARYAERVGKSGQAPPPPDLSSPASVNHGATPAHDSYGMHSGQSSGMTPYPATSVQHPGPSQAQAQHGAYGTHNSGGPSYSGMAPPYAPPSHPEAAPPRHAGTSHGGGSRAASQTPGNDPFAGLVAVEHAIFGGVQGNNPHSGGRPQASSSQYDAYSGMHNSGAGPSGRSQAGMAPMYPPHPPAIPHNPLAPIPQVPQHTSPYYDARYHAPGAAGMPNNFNVGGISHAGGGPAVPQVPISTPEGRRQLRPGLPPPDPKYVSGGNSLAAAMPMPKRPPRQ